MMEAAALREQFRAHYPESGEPFICRAPGRTNLIGEHTDYNGLPVLPLAVDREIWLAFAPRNDGVIRLRDTNTVFPPAAFNNARKIPPSAPGSWENYCKAAVQGLNEFLKLAPEKGMDILVTSDLPIAAGLASSSALVVACALAYLAANDITLDRDLDRLRLAETLAEAEHYVGTRGGGMDQAVILAGGDSQACKINFFPLRVERVPLLSGHEIIVCDSTIKAEKGGAMRARYNEGPRLCALLCAIVEKQLQAEIDEDVELERLGDLFYGPLCLTFREAEDICKHAITSERMTLSEIGLKLGMSGDEVRASWLGDLPEPYGGFPLQARLRHQITEYQRVERARDALLAGDAEELGRLMNASHQSCAHDYGISCPELDRLVEVAREAGALGARLTGAGFGGATVNLVPAARVDTFLATVEDRYYRAYLRSDKPMPAFIARAAAGAGYL